MSERRILALILGLFVVLGIVYAVVTPVFEASDELWHYPMIRHLADGNPLPVQVFDPAAAGPWKQEASQPPLYYYLGAALTFWIDTADMEQVRWQNPHVNNGVITADGNNNLVIHDPNANPWQGTLLAVHIVRFFSILLGAVTVYLTFRIAKEVAPARPDIALGAAAVTAFMPMLLFISGAVNNDNLIIPLAALALLLMIQAVTKQQATVVRWLLIGVVIGLAALTKISGVGLLALAVGTIFIARWQASAGKVSLRSLFRLLVETMGWLFVVLVPVLLIAGWWYYRNVVLYGDWRGWTAFIAVLGERPHAADLAQLWHERDGFMMAYWGLFGGVNVPMWMGIYTILNTVLILSVVGFAVYVFMQMKTERARIGNFPFRLQTLIPTLLNLVVDYFPLVICLLWSAAIVYGLVDWATTTWSSQGRLVFSALPALSTLMVVGLVGWLPRRAGSWVVAGLATFMFIVAAAAPWLWIRPAYRPPQEAPRLDKRVDVNFGDKMRLVGYEIDDTAVQPGDALWVRLEWEVLQRMERDWSTFVHLNDPVLERPIAQRDMYFGQGLRVTRLLQPGERLVESRRLQIPPTAIAPAELELAVGLYDYHTGERLPVTAAQSAATLAAVSLHSVPGQYPNPLAQNFENRLELVGFEVAPRRAHPGETVSVTLYWKATRPLDVDYAFFVQVVDLADTARYGHQDLQEVPTSTWPVGEVQALSFSFPLREDTPAGTYPIIVGVYTETVAGDFVRLRLVDNGRLTQYDFLQLTPMRIE